MSLTHQESLIALFAGELCEGEWLSQPYYDGEAVCGDREELRCSERYVLEYEQARSAYADALWKWHTKS